MTLIKSISGIRGTIGGKVEENLTPSDIVKFTAAYGTWLKTNNPDKKLSLVLGRDARISGEMVRMLVTGTLSGLGIDVYDIGLATTPTVEIAVTELQVDGGIILTASHNPAQWNALKLLNHKGEFISAQDGARLLDIASKESYNFAAVHELGNYYTKMSMTEMHIKKILDLPLVDVEVIRKANFKIAIDCVNSVGAVCIPLLLEKLGVKEILKLYCEPTGDFPHNPEPLPENLQEIYKLIKAEKADLGFVVDPDVDRLAIVCEDGTMFGEEYTLIAVADYVLGSKPGNTVSNLSSSRALREVTEKYGMTYEASAVGEVNVVEKMKEIKAVIGGEGNGGVIYPPLHYGRDALVGIALFLSFLARTGKSCLALRKSYPDYTISKNKIELTRDINVDDILKKIHTKYSGERITTIDGIKIDFEREWIHLRKSNTEPIIRIYAESNTKENADKLANNMINEIKSLI